MFYRCTRCESVLCRVFNGRGELSCCGEPLKALRAQKPDDKHLLLADCSGDDVSVTVGETPHPMEEDHRILFIALQTRDRIYFRKTGSLKRAAAKFSGVSGEFKIYAYCSNDGLFCDKAKSV